MKSNKTVTMPIMLATTSARLACRLTRGYVISSIMPIVKIAQKRSNAQSRENDSLNERMKRNVIVPYAKT